MIETVETGNRSGEHRNEATRIITVVLGITFAIGGLHHGFFEALQGNTRTESFVIQSIGPSQLMWEHGTDEAVTIIPNFLATGIAAMVVSLLIIFWCVRFMHLRHGPLGFLLLFFLLTLVGGGIGHIFFFLPTWAYSTRIDKPLKWWRRILSGGFGKIISAGWIYSVAFSSLSFIIALEISVFGYFPGVTNPMAILEICWGFLVLGLIFINVSYISGFAYDIGRTAANA